MKPLSIAFLVLCRVGNGGAVWRTCVAILKAPSHLTGKVVWLSSVLLVLATVDKAIGLTFDYSRTVNILSEGKFEVTSNLIIKGASNIHFMDGIGNSLEVFTPRPSPQLTGNVYFVNGINNNLRLLQAKELSTEDNIYLIEGINNYFKTSSLNFSSHKINPILKQEVIFNTDKNIYFIDGINNNLEIAEIDSVSPGISNTGNLYLVDGINNRLRSLDLSHNTNQSEINFIWNKSLVMNQIGVYYWSSRAAANGANNVYLTDGFNNLFQVLSLGSSNTGNNYVVDGINNRLHAFNSSDSLLEDFEDNRLFQWSKNLLTDNWNKGLLANTKNFYQTDGINQTNFTLSSQDSSLYSLDGINNTLTILPTNSTFFTLFNDFINSSESTDYVWTGFNNNAEETRDIPEPSLIIGLAALGLILLLNKPNLSG